MHIKNVTFLIDGFNLYHSARTVEKRNKLPAKWLDISKICSSRLSGIQQAVGARVCLKSIYYFSAYAYHLNDPAIVDRHKKFVKCLKDTGICVEINNFKPKDIWCPKCKSSFKKNEEKETDVSIAVKLLEVFITNECDIAVVVSGDTDLVPAVKAAQRMWDNKQVFFLFPAFRKNNELDQLCPGSMSIKADQYAKHQFSDPYVLKDETVVSKPGTWL